MKLGFKLMMFGLVAMVALPMFITKPDGSKMMSPLDWLPSKQTISEAMAKISGGDQALESERAIEVEPGDNLRGTAKMYSWRDANGRMHFSQEAPQDAAATVQLAELPSDVNTMQAVSVRNRSEASGGDQGGDQGFKLAFPTTVPVQDIPKLVKDAKNLQTLANKRNAAAQEL